MKGRQVAKHHTVICSLPVPAEIKAAGQTKGGKKMHKARQLELYVYVTAVLLLKIVQQNLKR